MPYLNGGDFYQLLKTCIKAKGCRDPNYNFNDWDKISGGISNAMVLAYFHQVVQGVAALHSSGIIHTDLKLENTMLSCRGGKCFASVIDLGLGCEPNVTGSCKTGGTPGYIAPEIWKGRGMSSPMRDVWSLGVMLYLVAYPRSPPFLADWRSTIHYDPRKDDAIGFTHRTPHHLDILITKMLEPDPRRRATIADVLSMLKVLIKHNLAAPPEVMSMIEEKPIDRGATLPVPKCLFGKLDYDVGDQPFQREMCMDDVTEAEGVMRCGVCVGCNPCCKCRVLRHGEKVKEHFRQRRTMAPELRQKGHDSFEHTASTAEVWPEPPPGQEGAMSIARPLKPRRLSFSGSTASGSGSLSLDDLATPQTTGGLDESLEGDLRMYGHPLGILDPLPGSGSPRGTAPPRAPAPTMPAMTAPPPPSYDVSLGRPEKPRRPGPCPLSELLPAPAAYASWPVTPASIPPASVPPTPSRGVPPVPVLSSGPPTPSGAAAPAPFADASQRGLHRPELHSATSEEDALLVQALSLLHSLLSGPIVPDLPPSGCYGGLKVSKAISEALGAEASKVQAAAVEGHGENPVKVLLPQYPIHPNLLSIDHTQPAKLQDPEAPDEVELELAKPPSPYGYMPNYPGPGMAPPPRPLLSPGAHPMAHPMPVIPR
ncbi:CIPK8 [Symbiodinium microadriaticum]|nr:CIPK8 [Symbiodinium microadriaticum]